MNPFLAEFVGTTLLLLLGNGVVANVVLPGTKGHGGGWIVITFGFAMAVFVSVWCVGAFSGAHLNPAVTLGLAAAGKFSWFKVAPFVAAQMLGAFTGSVLIFSFYHDHYLASDDADSKLATFCTGPAIRNFPNNFFCEVIGTFVLVFAVLLAVDPLISFDGTPPQNFPATMKVGLGSLGALPVGLLVLSIGLSLGGATGYAINPARDLGPRIAHALLPIPGKRDADWSYAAIPVVGPLVGGLLAAGVNALVL